MRIPLLSFEDRTLKRVFVETDQMKSCEATTVSDLTILHMKGGGKFKIKKEKFQLETILLQHNVITQRSLI